MKTKIGLVLPAGPQNINNNGFLEALDGVISEMEMVLDSLWITDHLFWNNIPTYEAWTTLSYMAAKWPRLSVGPIVLCQSYRNPALLAKMSATLQSLSGGRLIMALGAGWKEDEYVAYGYDFPQLKVRIEQLEDAINILKLMWGTQEVVNYEGKHYKVQNAYCEPKPSPFPPPLIIGGGGKDILRLTAQYADCWNLPDANIIKYKEKLSLLKSLCDYYGRDVNTIKLSWFGRLVVGNSEFEAIRKGGERWTKNKSLIGTSQQIVDQMMQFIDLGVDRFMIEIIDFSNKGVIHKCVDEIFSKLP